MKHYDIVGWAYEGSMYCPNHKPENVSESEMDPVFAGECAEDDYCETCLACLIHDGKDPKLARLLDD